jgi:hypothetical protein
VPGQIEQEVEHLAGSGQDTDFHERQLFGGARVAVRHGLGLHQ